VIRTVDVTKLPVGHSAEIADEVLLCTECGKPGIFLKGIQDNSGRVGFAHVVAVDDESRAGHVLVGCKVPGRGGQA
jgi:hypothetical protein